MHDLTKTNFEEKVINSKGIVLIKFGADWCGPCKMLDASLDQLNEIVIYKIDVDKEIDLMTEFNIRSVPTLIKFEDGQKVNEHIGVLSLKQLKEF